MRPTVGTDILKHHGPVMLTMLPLMLPYGLGIAAIEPYLPVPPPASSITLQVSGWGFVSSFNEFIMCPPSRDHARLKGPARRDPLPLPGPRCMQNTSDASFFRSHEACTVELAYKVLIFTTFSSLGSKAKKRRRSPRALDRSARVSTVSPKCAPTSSTTDPGVRKGKRDASCCLCLRHRRSWTRESLSW